jgi:hypothetical protein
VASCGGGRGERGSSRIDRRELDLENFEVLSISRSLIAMPRPRKSADGPARLAQSLDYLFTDPGAKVTPTPGPRRQMAPLWCRLYAMADTLALERQCNSARLEGLFAVGFIAFVCFAMFTHAGYRYALFTCISWLS